MELTGIELRTWRERHRLTQGQLAELLGVQLNTVSRWEIGKRSPPPGVVLDLALERLEQRLPMVKV